jgi:hypothetical protein
MQSAHGRWEAAEEIKDVDDSLSVFICSTVTLEEVSKDSERRQKHGYTTARLWGIGLPVQTSSVEVILADSASRLRRAYSRGRAWHGIDVENTILEVCSKAGLLECRFQTRRRNWKLMGVEVQDGSSVQIVRGTFAKMANSIVMELLELGSSRELEGWSRQRLWVLGHQLGNCWCDDTDGYSVADGERLLSAS